MKMLSVVDQCLSARGIPNAALLLLTLVLSRCAAISSYETYKGTGLTAYQQCVNRCDDGYGSADNSCGAQSMASAFSGSNTASLEYQGCRANAQSLREMCSNSCGTPDIPAPGQTSRVVPMQHSKESEAVLDLLGKPVDDGVGKSYYVNVPVMDVFSEPIKFNSNPVKQYAENKKIFVFERIKNGVLLTENVRISPRGARPEWVNFYLLRPAEGNPTLHESMLFIQDQLATQVDMPDASEDSSACRISYSKRTETDGAVASGSYKSLSLRSVLKINVLPISQDMATNVPAVNSPTGYYSLQIQGSNGLLAEFYFTDRNSANRVARTMIHAVELCGGGQ